MILPLEILKKYWKFDNFRTPQQEIINAVLNNKDVIALLPTGGGKSICFQIPALAKEGVCLVISPLIALMQNQVENLVKLGIKATTIPSGIDQNEIIILFDNIKFGNVKFLYISPERLQSKLIQQKLKETNINLVAIDEAHCISEWGNDFRPSYRNIKILKELKPNVNFIALTATANKRVLEDIEENLALENTAIFRKSFLRENLAYQLYSVEDKLLRLTQIVTKTKTPAIIYTNTRKNTVEISNYLNANTFKSSYYHAGLTKLEKQTSFTNWMTEKTPIMVATNAFGMGIDKPNVGLVIHYNLPFSIENYVQEAGRAGRNGKKSFAVLLYNENDILLTKERLQKALPKLSEIKEIHKKLYQYFTIATGEIFEESYSFNLQEFCDKYSFTPLKVDATLKILANNSVLEIGNKYNQKSTVQFITSHTEVLAYASKNNQLKQFINSLLRMYGGLFEQETTINEFLIAKKTSQTSKYVIYNLHKLHTDGLVHYNPTNTNTEITFLVPREDDRTIHRFSKEIKQFIHLKEKKSTDFIAFLKDQTKCRSLQILNYFDEESTTNCGICDVCIYNKKSTTINTSTEIKNYFVNNKSGSSQEISEAIKLNEQDILIHLQYLLAEDILALNNQNKFYLKKEL